MELTFKELKKRDVINVVDGKCLGHIVNLKIAFPSGTLTGIFVPGKKSNGIFRIFDRSEAFIPQKNIIKIGGDVILVDIKCGESCEQSVSVNEGKNSKPNKNPCQPCPPHNPCPPPNVCPPPCPPCPPQYPQCPPSSCDGQNFDNINGANFFDL